MNDKQVASDRAWAIERRALRIRRSIDQSRCREAARALATALQTGDCWWAGFAESCVWHAASDVRERAGVLSAWVVSQIVEGRRA